MTAHDRTTLRRLREWVEAQDRLGTTPFSWTRHALTRQAVLLALRAVEEELAVRERVPEESRE